MTSRLTEATSDNPDTHKLYRSHMGFIDISAWELSGQLPHQAGEEYTNLLGNIGLKLGKLLRGANPQ